MKSPKREGLRVAGLVADSAARVRDGACAGNEGHAQSDLISPQLARVGTNLLIDPCDPECLWLG